VIIAEVLSVFFFSKKTCYRLFTESTEKPENSLLSHLNTLSLYIVKLYVKFVHYKIIRPRKINIMLQIVFVQLHVQFVSVPVVRIFTIRLRPFTYNILRELSNWIIRKRKIEDEEVEFRELILFLQTYKEQSILVLHRFPSCFQH